MAKKSDKITVKITRRQRYRMHPNEEQATFMRKNCGAARYVYNELLRLDEQDHRAGKKFRKRQYPELFADAPWLKEMDSNALDSAKRDYYKAWSNYRKDAKAGKPKRKKKNKSRKTYRTNNHKDCQSIWVRHHKLKLPKMKPIRIEKHRPLPSGCRILSATVEEETRDVWYVSICYEMDIEIPKKRAILFDDVIGIDYSSPLLFVDDRGRSPHLVKQYRTNEQRISFLQSKKDRRDRESSGWWKAFDKTAKEHAGVKRKRSDAISKLTAEMVASYGIVIGEDLDLRALAKSFSFGKATNDNGFGLMRAQLAYKLADCGGAFVKTPRFFASSKTCNVCGEKNEELLLGEVEWMCKRCGTLIERDVNAARNELECGLFCLFYEGYVSEVLLESGEVVDVRKVFGVGTGSVDASGLFEVIRNHKMPDGSQVAGFLFDCLAALFDEEGNYVPAAVMLLKESSDVWVSALRDGYGN